MSSPNNTRRKQETKRVVRVVKTTRNGKEAAASPLLPLCLLALLGLLFYSYRTAPRVSDYFDRRESTPILVYDNVLSSETCKALHGVAVDFKQDTAGKSVLFHWPTPKPTNYIEQVIDSILLQMYENDSNEFEVEYWVRQTWHHTIAHADTDEGLFERTGKLRHPYKGHVLYLKKGSLVNGPTVVFSNITRGGDMYSSQNTQHEVIICPFVSARLLQFDGELLHAVPRPPDLWLHPNNDELPLEPFEEYGRSVILFNLWKKPPLGLAYTSDMSNLNKRAENDKEKPLSNPKREWQEAPIVSDWQESLWDFVISMRRSFQLPLMGNAARRGTRDLALQLQATRLVEDALVSSSHDPRPKRVYLETPRHKQVQIDVNQEL